MASIERLNSVTGSKEIEMRKHLQEITVVQNDEPPKPNTRPACFRSTVQEILFILTATMGIAMSTFLIGCTIVISTFAARDLNMTTSERTWITASSA